MFQKSLLKNFVKSFNVSDYSDIINLVTKNKYIAEDANGAEFINLLAKMLNWNIKREVKNNKDRKKADAVVYDKNSNPIAIIELKSSDKDISNRDIVAQAFRYKNEKPTCRYVIISNFKQLDIYSDSSDVCFTLDMREAKSYPILYALLNQSSLENNEIARLKNISKTQEEITKEVYKEYSSFRLKLLNNIIKNNPNLSKEEIFLSANKLLDRFMFILFAEDRGLIPANSIDTIIKKYESSKEWGDNTPLYDYYKKYFHFIDVGNPKIKIPKYNGNLFKPDKKLENLIIDDNIIKDDLSHLSAYDFSDDVDVEVLGHIFEQSLNDLEEIKKDFFENYKIIDKRKKSGVYYTPKFITEYIINNTIGKVCQEKKEELKLFDEVKNSKKAKEKRRDTLHKYREFLEELKIIDPACGSGAFLNASFRYLFNEHKWIQKELLKYGANLFEHHDIDKQIIENNLYGVDINSASVGITKLSLWLQTAKRDRPLSNLVNNIKCANSLTANWNELFPEIMVNGFDVVIGNPPYVRQEMIKELKPLLKKRYKTFTGTADLFVYFYELAYNLLKDRGLNGFICSNKFFRAKYGEKLREMILTKTAIKNIVDFNGVKIFEDATVDSAITILEKGYKKDNTFQISFKNLENFFSMAQNDLTKESFTFLSPKELAIKKKIEKIGIPLKEWDIKINYGIKTGFNEAFIIDGAKREELIRADRKSEEIIKPILRGRDIKRYSYKFADKWLIYIPWDFEIDNYPAIKEHLSKYYNKLSKRPEVKANRYNWYALSRYGSDYVEEFEKEKIIWAEMTDMNNFMWDDEKYYINQTCYFMTNTNKYMLAVLNSKIIYFYIHMIASNLGTGAIRWIKQYIEKLPIPQIPKSIKKYLDNINYLLNMPKKAKYDKNKKYAIAEFKGREIYTTEFLMAKELGYIDKFQGHSELKEYLKLIPYLFANKYFNDIYKNIDNNRTIYALNENERKIFHIIDEKNYLVSIFVVSKRNFEKQLGRRFTHIESLDGGTATPHILSPARPFWRHLSLFEELYQKIKQKSITQEDFIILVDKIIDSKEKIAKYKKYFDTLNAVDKIEIKEEIEKLEEIINDTIDKIDRLVYKLYDLSSEEIKIIENG